MSEGGLQTIRRSKHERDYLCISNDMARNRSLSYEARGLLFDLLSRPDDWEVHVAELQIKGKAGRDKVYRIIAELIEARYILAREPIKDDQGKIISYTPYIVADKPFPEKADTENQEAAIQEAGNQNTEKPTLQSTDIQNKEKQSTEPKNLPTTIQLDPGSLYEPAEANEQVGQVSSAFKDEKENLQERTAAKLKAEGVHQYKAAAALGHPDDVVDRVIAHKQANNLQPGWIFRELQAGAFGIRDGLRTDTPKPPPAEPPPTLPDVVTPWHRQQIEDERRAKQMASLLEQFPDLQAPTDNDRTAFEQLITVIKDNSTQAIRALGSDNEHLLMGIQETEDNARELHIWLRSTFMVAEMERVQAWLVMRNAWRRIIDSANLVYAVPQDLRIVWRHEALADGVMGRVEKEPAKTWKRSA